MNVCSELEKVEVSPFLFNGIMYRAVFFTTFRTWKSCTSFKINPDIQSPFFLPEFNPCDVPWLLNVQCLTEELTLDLCNHRIIVMFQVFYSHETAAGAPFGGGGSILMWGCGGDQPPLQFPITHSK